MTGSEGAAPKQFEDEYELSIPRRDASPSKHRTVLP